nr:hypothetical protein BaRGS_015308 [Batillaria attramentaria]
MAQNPALTVLTETGRKGKSFTSFSDAILQIDCISCIRAILNTPLGIDHLLHSSDDTNKLVIGLNISNTLPKKQILEMAAAVCAHSALGYKRILEGLDHLKRKTNQYHRFSMIVNELKSAETVPHKTAVMTFINTLINCNLDLNQRCRVRNQMIDALQSRVFGTGRMVSLVNILQDLLAIEVLDKQEKSSDAKLEMDQSFRYCSRFLLHLMDIPDYRTLLLGHLTRLEFAANISRLQRALKAMVGGLQVRPGQQGPVDLLQLVVRVGNFLNHTCLQDLINFFKDMRLARHHHRSRSDLTDSICLPNKWLRYEEMKMRERESKNTEGAPLAVPESSLTLATLNLEDGWGYRCELEDQKE